MIPIYELRNPFLTSQYKSQFLHIFKDCLVYPYIWIYLVSPSTNMVPMVSGVSTEVRQSAMDAFVTLASHLRPGDCGDQVSFAPCFVAGKWDKSMAIIWGLWGNDINLIDKYWWLICFLMYKILRRYYNIIRLSFFGSNWEPRISLQDVLGWSKKHLPSFFKASLSSVWLWVSGTFWW